MIRYPGLWHFAFHNILNLPEMLVSGNRAVYFDYFFDVLSTDPKRIGPDMRAAYVAAYARPEALRSGFEWYRAFEQDVKDNIASMSQEVTIPVLYARGAQERGELDVYVRELVKAGLRRTRGEIIPDSGHFTADEQPVLLAEALRRFVRDER